MYFVVDGLLIGLFLLVLVTSIKRGLSGHFVFGILRTIIGIAAGAAAVAGAYLLMTHFAWLDNMADGVAGFFGEIRMSLGIITEDVYRLITGIIAFLPFAVLFFIVGYLLGTKVICGLISLIFYPIKALRKNAAIFRFLDNLLGIVLNVGLYAVVVLAIFGGVYVFNYDRVEADNTVSYELKEEVADLAIVDGDGFLARTISNFTTPILDGLNESFIAAPIASLIYENNPLFMISDGMVYTTLNDALIAKK